jgi:alkaline phosphatase D
MNHGTMAARVMRWGKWIWVRNLITFYVMAVFTNMMGCSFYYLQPDILPGSNRVIPGEAQTIIFASCNNQNIQTPIFDVVSHINPDLFVWTGDIIYPDWPIPWPGNNLDKIAHKYALLSGSEAYRNMSSKIPVTGIYDDHDFGQNNGGAIYPYKKESKQLLQQFLQEDEHEERSQHSGAYTWYRLQSGSLQYALVLLDTRYFRENAGSHSQLLGDGQWRWLDSILHQDSLDFYMIVSGTSILSMDHENEGWWQYPAEKEKLFSLLGTVQVPVVFVAGDKHFGEMNMEQVHGVRYVEMVASGLTHTEAPGKHYHNSIQHSNRFVGENFGRITIPDSMDGELILEVLDKQGLVRLEQSISLNTTGDMVCNISSCGCQSQNNLSDLTEKGAVSSLTRSLQQTTSYLAGWPLMAE